MSWRTVVISSSAKLDYQMGYLIVRNQDVVKVHISEISILMIETTSVSLTAALLCELTKKKIKVIFCDEKRNPSSELIPYYGSHDTSMKVRKQIAWSEDIKKSVWTEIVTEKIRKQAENLERWDRTEAQMLYEYITQIEFPALKEYYTHHMKDGTFVSWLAFDGENIVGTSGMSFVEKPPYFGCPTGKIGLLSSIWCRKNCSLNSGKSRRHSKKDVIFVNCSWKSGNWNRGNGIYSKCSDSWCHQLQ